MKTYPNVRACVSSSMRPSGTATPRESSQLRTLSRIESRGSPRWSAARTSTRLRRSTERNGISRDELVELVEIEQQLVDPVAEGVVRRHVALVLEQRVVEARSGASRGARKRALGGREAAHGTVLVEAPAQVRARVVGPAHAELARASARARRRCPACRRGARGHAGDHVTFGDALRLVQRDAELGRIGEACRRLSEYVMLTGRSRRGSPRARRSRPRAPRRGAAAASSPRWTTVSLREYGMRASASRSSSLGSSSNASA